MEDSNYKMKVTITVPAGRSSSGVLVNEELLVEEQGENRYMVLASPGLVQGIAAGDIIHVSGCHDGFIVARRGGNLCVQIFSREDVEQLDVFASELISDVGGRLDGKSCHQLVYTVPIAVGFEAIESVLTKVTRRFPDADWYYGNVYDRKDGITPLNWWKITEPHAVCSEKARGVSSPKPKSGS